MSRSDQMFQCCLALGMLLHWLQLVVEREVVSMEWVVVLATLALAIAATVLVSWGLGLFS